MVSFSTLQTSLESVLSHSVSQRIFPGAVIGVAYKGDRFIFPYGHQTYEDTADPLTAESVYDVASITKSIPTSLLALKLIEEKKLFLHQHVSEVLSDFCGQWKDQVTLFHLLTQTVDFGLQLSSYKDSSPDNILHTIMHCDLKTKPGTTYAYTNSTSIVLGLVIEKVSKKSLATLAREYLFEPLQMRHTGFDPNKFPKNMIVPTEIDFWRKREIRGEVHDESAFTLSKKYTVGSAGLFSTVPDLLNVLEMLLSEGLFRKKRIFSKITVKSMYTNQLPKSLHSSGLGWEMNKEFMGGNHSVKTIGKTGFTGCVVCIDFENEIGIVILSNHHYPHRSDSEIKHLARAKIIDTILSQIV